MPKSLCAIALAPLLAMLCAADAPSIIQQAFGATIVSTYPDNRKAELWLQPSGAYTARGRRGDGSSGRWKVDGHRLCLKQERPRALPFFRYCTPIPSQDHWTAKAVTGETIQVRLVKDRPGETTP